MDSLKQIKIQAKAGFGFVLAASSVFMISSAPAKADACADSQLSVLQAAAACTDVLGFTFKLNSYTNFSGLDQFSFQSAITNFEYSVQGASSWTTAGNDFTLDYTLTAPAGKEFNFYTANLNSANDPALDAGTFDITSLLQPASGPAAATFTPPLQASGGVATYSPKLISDNYTGTLRVTGGTISSVTGVVVPQDFPRTSSVPGPLPLLGAFAGFGISRKIRNRIKSVA